LWCNEPPQQVVKAADDQRDRHAEQEDGGGECERDDRRFREAAHDAHE
jgi:hypothetical protein